MKKILLVLIALVALFILIGFLLPSDVHVERSITINAPVEEVFPKINNLHEFNKWSPWHKKDPNAKYTFEGPDSGIGMKMSWVSEDNQVGSGSQEIIQSVENKSVKTSLDFGEMGQAQALLSLEPEGQGTKVTWSFDEDTGMNPMNRWFGVFMDKLLGPFYEEGLASLKVLAEKPE